MAPEPCRSLKLEFRAQLEDYIHAQIENAMATAHGTTPELEFPNTDNFLDNFLVFNSGKNQFKWTGSVQQLESFIFQTLNISQEHAQSKANTTGLVWCGRRLMRLSTFI